MLEQVEKRTSPCGCVTDGSQAEDGKITTENSSEPSNLKSCDERIVELRNKKNRSDFSLFGSEATQT